MLTFTKYPSLENVSREKVIQYMRETKLNTHEYIVQEKIHGSNLCLMTDGTVVEIAKRSGFLASDEVFYNHPVILEKYQKSALKAFEYVKSLYPDTESLAVFGELFGGIYPHPDVPAVSASVRCQKHIYYSPENDFCAFDILKNTDCFLDYDVAEKIFKDSGFLYSKALDRGDLDTVMGYDPVFETLLPSQLGYPSIPNNLAEGVVIKPAFPSRWNDNAYKFCLKQKNPAYKEKIKGGPVLPKDVMSVSLQQLIEEGLSYVTEGRYGSVVSKIGSVTRADHGRVMGAYAQDLLVDFLKDYEEAYNALEKNEQKQWKRMVNKTAGQAIGKWLQEA